MSVFDLRKFCPLCGGGIGDTPYYYPRCKCYQQKSLDYKKLCDEFMKERNKPKPVQPTSEAMEYEKFADIVAAKVVALLGKKKKRRAKR